MRAKRWKVNVYDPYNQKLIEYPDVSIDKNGYLYARKNYINEFGILETKFIYDLEIIEE